MLEGLSALGGPPVMLVECLAIAAGALLAGGGLCLAIGEHPREAPGRMRRDLIAYFETGIGGILLVCALLAASI